MMQKAALAVLGSFPIAKSKIMIISIIDHDVNEDDEDDDYDEDDGDEVDEDGDDTD